MPGRNIFITGGTGYMGSRLIPLLTARGNRVTALVRPGSESALLPERPGAGGADHSPLKVATGNALDAESLRGALGDCDTWVQLIGTPHPAPWKGDRFRAVDLQAVKASIAALAGSGIRHYVYLSVAQPAPVMGAYVQVRQEAEARLRETGLAVSFIRPWYVLGPGHRWPAILTPAYKILERWPATREGALRLGLVTLGQMLATLIYAADNPPVSLRVYPVPEIRSQNP